MLTTDETKQEPSKRNRKGNGEGNIRQRKDGRWETRVFVETTDLRSVRKSIYGDSWDEVHDELTKIKSDLLAGLRLPTTQETVGQYLEHWLESNVRDRVRASTYYSYRSQVELYLVPFLGRRKLTKLTARDIKKALAQLKDRCRCCVSGLDLRRKQLADAEREKRRGKKVRKNARKIEEARCCAAKPKACCQNRLSDATIRYLHRILRTALQDAVIDGVLVHNVAKELRLPHKYAPKFEPWTSTEVMRFLEVNKDHRLIALFGIVLAVGLRRGEALALRWSDVNVETGVLHIERTLNRVKGKLRIGPVKTEQSDRVVSLPEPFLWALHAHRTNQNEERAAAGDKWEDHGLMFTTPKGTSIEPRNLNRLLDVLSAKAEVRRIRFHDLRHTFATLLYEQGVTVEEIQDVLGHSSPAITKLVYIRPSRQAPPKTANKVGFLFSKPALGSALGSNPGFEDTRGVVRQANNPSELSQHSARSEGLEPPTF